MAEGIKFKARIDKAATEKIVKKLGGVKDIIKKNDADAIGRNCVSAMLKQISQGTSPVQGWGRFPRYKDKNKYPGPSRLKDGKKYTPVNLRLTGQFLESLDYKVHKGKGGYYVSIGYGNRTAQKKEQGHREGANGQPVRPTIPQDGETFSRVIQEEYLSIIEEAVKRFTS
jgi:hypothetical protein